MIDGHWMTKGMARRWLSAISPAPSSPERKGDSTAPPWAPASTIV